MAKSSRLIISMMLLVTLFSTHGCKSKADADQSQDAATDQRSPEEEVVEKLQGAWSVDLEPTMEAAQDLEDREKLVARELLANLRLSIDGTKGSVTNRILGSSEAQDWDLSIKDVDGANFQLCVTHENLEEPQCNAAQWEENGFRLETSDGLVTFYVPAEEIVDEDATPNGDAPSPTDTDGNPAQPSAGDGGQ